MSKHNRERRETVGCPKCGNRLNMANGARAEFEARRQWGREKAAGRTTAGEFFFIHQCGRCHGLFTHKAGRLAEVTAAERFRLEMDNPGNVERISAAGEVASRLSGVPCLASDVGGVVLVKPLEERP